MLHSLGLSLNQRPRPRRLLGGTTIKMPAVVGPLVGIKLVRGIKSALIKRGRKSRRERGRNLSSSFIAQDSVEQFAVEQKSIIHYNAMRA